MSIYMIKTNVHVYMVIFYYSQPVTPFVAKLCNRQRIIQLDQRKGQLFPSQAQIFVSLPKCCNALSLILSCISCLPLLPPSISLSLYATAKLCLKFLSISLIMMHFKFLPQLLSSLVRS